MNDKKDDAIRLLAESLSYVQKAAIEAKTKADNLRKGSYGANLNLCAFTDADRLEREITHYLESSV